MIVELTEQEKLNILHTMVWNFREKYGQWFKTPSPLEALWFAEEEIGEARRAWIRQNTDGWNRNSDEKGELYKELTQTLMMLLSMSENNVFKYDKTDKEYQAISYVGKHIYTATFRMELFVAEESQNTDYWKSILYSVNVAISSLMEMIPRPIVSMQSVLNEIYSKRIEKDYLRHSVIEIGKIASEFVDYINSSEVAQETNGRIAVRKILSIASEFE